VKKAYIGIDPGLKGSFCLLIPETQQVLFLPTITKPLEIHQWFTRVKAEFNLVVCMIEDVHSIFGVSAKSNFNFGYNVGLVNALASASGSMVDLVQPKKWQKTIGVTVQGKLIKNDVAAICERLYPKVNIRGPKGGLLDGLSDSLMIAHYASLTHVRS
jgi:hypothetical protein